MKKINLFIFLVLSLLFASCFGKDIEKEVADVVEEKELQGTDQVKRYDAKDEDSLYIDGQRGLINYRMVEFASRFDYDNEFFADMDLNLLSVSKLKGVNYYFLETKDGQMYNSMQRLAGLDGSISAEAQARIFSTRDDESSDAGLNFSIVPNDDRLDEMNANEITQLDRAWAEFGFGDFVPYIGVIDSGINFDHEDLIDMDVVVARSRWDRVDLANGGTAYEALGADADGNPIFVEMLDSKYASYNEGFNWDQNIGHGTHVTGTIVATGDNEVGIAGVNWNSKLLTYKVFADNPPGEAAAKRPSGNAVYDSLKDLIDQVVILRKEGKITQATVPVNFSIGGTYANSYALAVVNYGLENGVLLVTSAGNSGTYKDGTFPSAFSGALTVGAGSIYGDATGFSTAVNNLSVIAPGNAILSVSNWANNEYINKSGTSMAAPFLTGMISYMLTFDPTLTPSEIRSIVEQTADPVENGWQTGYSDEIYKDKKWSPKNGYGRVNVYKAIKAVKGDYEEIRYEYSTKPLRVVLTSANPYYSDNGLEQPRFANEEIYLYSLDKHNNKTFVSAGTTDINGVVEFNMLKEGRYSVQTTTKENKVLAQVVDFKIGEEVTEVSLDKGTLVWNLEIIPVKTDGKDAIVGGNFLMILDETKNPIYYSANAGNNFGQFEFTSAGTYYLAVGTFNNYTYDDVGGNYGVSIYAGSKRPDYVVPATNQDGSLGVDTNIATDTLDIELNKVYFATLDEDEFNSVWTNKYGNYDNFKLTITEAELSK